MSPVTLHEGEVYVDGAGNYIGDFSAGRGTSGPLGWTHCVASNDSHSWWIFQSWWEDPNYQAVNAIGPISYEFPTQQIDIVDDVSGPPGKETQKAAQLWMAGTPGHMTWCGAAGSQRVGSGPTPAQIGWYPQHNSQWVFEGWFRTIPDAAYYGSFLQPEATSGYVAQDFQFGFAMGMYGYPTIGAGTLRLTQDWQHLSTVVTWPYASCDPAGSPSAAIPTVWAADSRFYYSETHDLYSVIGIHYNDTRYAPRYQVRMKEVHLYPYGAPLIPQPGTQYSVADKF